MNTLALTFAICLVPATAFLIWLFTPWGRNGQRNCKDEVTIHRSILCWVDGLLISKR